MKCSKIFNGANPVLIFNVYKAQTLLKNTTELTLPWARQAETLLKINCNGIECVLGAAGANPFKNYNGFEFLLGATGADPFKNDNGIDFKNYTEIEFVLGAPTANPQRN